MVLFLLSLEFVGSVGKISITQVLRDKCFSLILLPICEFVELL